MSLTPLKRWLGILAAAYNVRLSDDALIAFSVVLGDRDAEDLEMAFTTALRSHAKGFPPAPAEVLEYLKIARESNPRERADLPDCDICKNTRFKIVEQSDGAKFAVPCDCLPSAAKSAGPEYVPDGGGE